MQKTKEELEDRQNKLYFEKLKKEKKQEEEHRKRIREQIARDRAEQLAARQAEKERRESAVSASSSPGQGKRPRCVPSNRRHQKFTDQKRKNSNLPSTVPRTHMITVI